MKKIFYIIALSIVFLGSHAVSAQESSIAPEKKALIQELITLVDLDKLSFGQKIDDNSTSPIFTAWVKGQNGLSDEQMERLKKSAAESSTRTDAALRQFADDKDLANRIFLKLIVEALDKEFTTDELTDVVAYCRQPTGKKGMKFMMQLLNRMPRKSAEEVAKMFKDLLQKTIEQEIDNLKKLVIEMKGKSAGSF